MGRKKPEANYSLFETQSLTTETNLTEQQESSMKQGQDTLPVDPDACPRCKRKGLKSVRPQEYRGLTHYCGRCAGSEPGEPYRWTPGEVATLKTPCPACNYEDHEVCKLLGHRYGAKGVVVEEPPIEVSATKYDQEHLFVKAEDVPVATGKTVEALEYSRARTQELMREFSGELPQSVMKAERKSRGASDLSTGSYDAARKYKGAFAQSCAGAHWGGLSQFPQNIGRAVVQLYTKKGDTVVDPFAGHNSRMELCVKLGRHYIGCDLSHNFMEFNRTQAERLRKEFPEVKIELHETDSRKMSDHVEQWAGDFTLTSPPYYNIEDYGDEPCQLGKLTSYADFLRGLGKVAEQNFSALKSGAYCVWFINDFRLDGVFNAFHIDTYNLLRNAGFAAHDMLITDFGGSFGACFPAQVVDRKILPKRHEYGVIMRKL